MFISEDLALHRSCCCISGDSQLLDKEMDRGVLVKDTPSNAAIPKC